jgi:hypothetical protein
MSFAINAAPINNEENINLLGETIIDQKKNQFKKTQKKSINFNSAKVNAVLENLQNMEDLDDNENEMGNFQPLSPPQSMGVENTKSKDVLNPNTNNIDIPLPRDTGMITSGNNSESINGKTDEVDIQSLKDNFMNKNAVKEYFSNLIPNYNSINSGYPEQSTKINETSVLEQNDTVIHKLNYMINLLEDQQNEKTSNVTEEIILYTFLGIFIIFIVDSFARVGKYTR